MMPLCCKFRNIGVEIPEIGILWHVLGAKLEFNCMRGPWSSGWLDNIYHIYLYPGIPDNIPESTYYYYETTIPYTGTVLLLLLLLLLQTVAVASDSSGRFRQSRSSRHPPPGEGPHVVSKFRRGSSTPSVVIQVVSRCVRG